MGHNNEFDATPKHEHLDAQSGDRGVSKINFSDVMQGPDKLTEAFAKNQEAIAAATQKVAQIHERVAAYFGKDTEGHKNFLADHENFYAKTMTA